MLVSTGVDHRRLLADLRAVIVDEVHAFGSGDRGWHLIAVLERLSRIASRPLQRGRTLRRNDFASCCCDEHLLIGWTGCAVRTDFCTWITLALLALIAIWIYERPRQGRVTTAVHRRIYLAFESGKVILLVFIVARCVWKGFDLASKATVTEMAQKALFGSPAPAAAHYVTNYSFGLTILPIGLIFAALGVLSGDKALKVALDAVGIPVAVAPKVTVKAWALALAAIIFIAVTYGLFNG